MNKDITLVIMAAGMGSRFGGLKQIEPLGPNKELLIDYSIYDAKRAGFTKVVFIIRKNNYEIFKELIGDKLEGKIKVEYAFQELDNIPEGVIIPEGREKPLGTAHALYCAREFINGPFAVISADDFYGKEAFELLGDSLINTDEYSLIGYKIGNTITENGSVKRGVCEIEQDNLKGIIESSVERNSTGKIIATPLDEAIPAFEVQEDDTVSMNMLLFTPSIFTYIEDHFKEFLDKNQDNLEKCEYLIPDVLFQTIEENYATCKVISTTSTWYGVTYKEDADGVKKALKDMVEKGEYPEHLWD